MFIAFKIQTRCNDTNMILHKNLIFQIVAIASNVEVLTSQRAKSLRCFNSVNAVL